MAITRREKEALVEGYSEALTASRAVFLAKYTGLTVAEMERLRSALRQEETYLAVLRNTLFALASEKTGFEVLGQAVEGPTLAIFCRGDPTSPAKTLSDLSRELEELSVYGGWLGGSLLTAEEFSTLANLPGREELLAKLVGSLQSPVHGFVSVLSGVLRGLLYVLQARAGQLGGETSVEAA